MFSKNKGHQQIPSDIQAKEKLAHYVYEYLMHLGAKQSAQTFLQEIRWDKNVPLGEAPGFLSSWWCVFWDLYCATPERRNQFEATDEAKAFHDYTQNSQSQSTNPLMMGGQSQFNRFPSNSRNMQRLAQNIDYNNSPNNNSVNNNSNIDQSRVQSSMSPMNRLTPPANRGMNVNNQQAGSQPMGFNNQNQLPSQPIRSQNQNNSNQNINAPMSPMPMNMNQQHSNRWSSSTQGPPAQNQSQPANSSSTNFHEQNMSGNMHNVPINNEISHHSQINGEIMEPMKNTSMSNIPGRIHEDNTGNITDINAYQNFGESNLF